MIVKTLDSIQAPTAAQLDAAYADGVRAWNGYLYWPKNWSKASFDLIKAHGMKCIAYQTGWGDPVASKALAASWGVAGCLDIENGTRPNGSWVAPWLAASGFGYYASRSGYPIAPAPFHIVAEYITNDPGTSWPAGFAVPGSTPHGWQWHGSIGKYGANVDLNWFDSTVWGAPAGAIAPLVDNEPMWLLYLVSGGDATQYVFTGRGSVPMSSVADVDVLVANGNLKSNHPATVSLAQHLHYVAAGGVSTITPGGSSAPQSFTGTIELKSS